MNNNHIRRKRSLVDKEIQFGFAWIILGYLLLYTLFFVLLFQIPIWWIINHTPGKHLDKMAAVGTFITSSQHFWVLIVIFIIMVAFHFIIISRKFAGPIFAIRRQLQRAQNGELNRINLRKSDYLHDIKDLLNDHFDKLADTMTHIRVTLESVDSLLEGILTKENTELTEETQKKLSNIHEQISELKHISQQTWHYSE